MSHETTVPSAPPPSPEAPASPVTPVVADPAPLGLAGFAMTTMALSALNAHLLDARAAGPILALALMYGGIAQLLAGMWEFRRNNTFGALAFSSYGAFWLSFWAIETLYPPLGPDAANGLGLYLTLWGIFTTYMLIASLRTTGAVMLVFLLLAITYWLLVIGAFGGSISWTKAGGYVGFATAAAAWYASFAGVTNATWGRTVLPVIPLGRELPRRPVGAGGRP